MRKRFERRGPRWWAVSIVVHVFAIAGLGQIVFRYPLGQLIGIPDPEISQERLQYIALPAAAQSSGRADTVQPSRSATPAALRAPMAVPSEVSPPTLIDSSRAQAAGATGAGLGVDASGLATGVEPRQPDPRIELLPGPIVRPRRTVVEDVDSIVRLAVGIVSDSLALREKNDKRPEWVKRGKDGQLWGLDSANIYLGKVKIPAALLALLPLNAQSRVSPIEARSMAYIRRDVLENAQRAVSEDEFRAAVKRIRERKEREKRQKMLAADTKDKTATP